MGKEMLMLGNIEIKKIKFYCNRTPISLKYVNIEKVIVSNKISFGEKKPINFLLATFIMIIKLNLTYNASKKECICKKL